MQGSSRLLPTYSRAAANLNQARENVCPCRSSPNDMLSQSFPLVLQYGRSKIPSHKIKGSPGNDNETWYQPIPQLTSILQLQLGILIYFPNDLHWAAVGCGANEMNCRASLDTNEVL